VSRVAAGVSFDRVVHLHLLCGRWTTTARSVGWPQTRWSKTLSRFSARTVSEPPWPTGAWSAAAAGPATSGLRSGVTASRSGDPGW